MAKGGAAKGENTKKAAGNAKKADAAAAKDREASARAEAAQQAEWSKGAKDSSKKAAQEEKAAEAARKKAEKEALLKEEEASLPSKPKGGGKGAVKKGEKSKGTLDLGQLESGGEERKKGALNASGIDNAIDALSLTGGSGAGDKVDRHPERRFKAAYAAYEEKRLEELKDEKGLRRQQKIDMVRKEFEKHPDNPFNQQLAGRFDMSKEEMKELREAKREEIEGRLEQK